MAISLADLKKVRADKPPRVLIYGPPKMGKTTLASEFPAPVFLQTEEGESGSLELTSFGHLTTYEQVQQAMIALMTEEHGFQTVVVDSLTKMEALVFAETCRRHKWQTIEQPGYGKGYKEADYVWLEFLEGINHLRSRGMTTVLIGHATTERFDDPTTSSYTRYDIDLDDRARSILCPEVDAILLIKQDVAVKSEDLGFNNKRTVGQGGDARWIYCQNRPAYTAGNRYDMPEKLLYEQGKGFAVLAPYFPQPVAAPAAQAA